MDGGALVSSRNWQDRDDFPVGLVFVSARSIGLCSRGS